jgi:hypothetical protein
MRNLVALGMEEDGGAGGSREQECDQELGCRHVGHGRQGTSHPAACIR